MATPPRDQPSEPSYGAGGPGYRLGAPGTWSGARMPVPGNAELFVLALVAILLAILAWVADGLTDRDWFDAFKWFVSAYLISRGIAKASRVLER